MTINDDFTREMLFTPADAEAERLAVAEHEPRYTAEGRDGFAFGFAAGLRHARKWRALTSDPATWPEEGVLVLWRWWHPGDMSSGTRRGRHVYGCGETETGLRVSDAASWLPLPAPPEVTP